MAKAVKQSSPFEQSFMLRMIRDFFPLLLLVAGLVVMEKVSGIVFFKSDIRNKVFYRLMIT